MTAGEWGKAIVGLVIWAVLGFGVIEIAVGLVRIVKTWLFRRRLQQELARCAEDWPKGYNEWKARQAA